MKNFGQGTRFLGRNSKRVTSESLPLPHARERRSTCLLVVGWYENACSRSHVRWANTYCQSNLWPLSQ